MYDRSRVFSPFSGVQDQFNNFEVAMQVDRDIVAIACIDGS